MRLRSATSLRRAAPAALCAALALCGTAGPAAAGFVEPLALISYSPDITASFGATTVGPDNVADEVELGVPTLIDIGPIPPNANVVGYHRLPDGDHLLAFDTTVVLHDLTVAPSDIVRTDGTSSAFFFAGAANGIPNGTAIDALSMVGDDLLLSFDTAVRIDGVTFESADVARFDGADFTLFFDAAAAGVAPGLNLDALHYLDSERLLLSFDGSGSIGGVAFDDEDVLAYDPSLDAWLLLYDGSAAHPEWATADLDALGAAPVLATPTATASLTATPPSTATSTHSASPSSTPTLTAVVTASATFNPVATATATVSPQATRTEVATATATVAASASPTQTGTASVTPTPVASVTATSPPSPTGSATVAATPTVPTFTASATPTATPTPTTSAGATATAATATATATIEPPMCAGDCNGDEMVTIDELIRGVGIALGNLPITDCLGIDRDDSGDVTIDELVGAVAQALADGGDCSPPLVAVLSALQAELAPVLERATVEQTSVIEGRVFRVGRLGGARVVLAMTGLGLANAKVAARLVFEHFEVGGVVVSAVAGSPRRIGDVIVPETWSFADDTTQYVVEPQWLALAGQVAAPGGAALERCTLIASQPEHEPVCLEHEPAVFVGGAGQSSDPFGDAPVPCRVGGDDVFGCDVAVNGSGSFAAGNAAETAPELPAAVDMETAAIAREAVEHGVPFIAFRAVSDGESDPLMLPGFPSQFFAYYRFAARNAAIAATAFLARLEQPDAMALGPR